MRAAKSIALALAAAAACVGLARAQDMTELEELLQEIVEQNLSPRRVQVVAHLPGDASFEEIVQTVREMESVAMMFFADEEDLLGEVVAPTRGRFEPVAHKRLRVRGPFLPLQAAAAAGPGSSAFNGDAGRSGRGRGIKLCSCHREMHTLCKAELPADFSPRAPTAGEVSRVISCLQDHSSELNNRCAAALDRLQVTKYCQNDVVDFCDNVRLGGGRVHDCLMSHASQLSPTCKAYFAFKKQEMISLPAPEARPLAASGDAASLDRDDDDEEVYVFHSAVAMLSSFRTSRRRSISATFAVLLSSALAAWALTWFLFALIALLVGVCRRTRDGNVADGDEDDQDVSGGVISADFGNDDDEQRKRPLLGMNYHPMLV